MLIIPAIDLKNGTCVRLRQGRMDDATVYSDDPVATASRWVEAGAERLHVVDLDGALRVSPKIEKRLQVFLQSTLICLSNSVVGFEILRRLKRIWNLVCHG